MRDTTKNQRDNRQDHNILMKYEDILLNGPSPCNVDTKSAVLRAVTRVLKFSSSPSAMSTMVCDVTTGREINMARKPLKRVVTFMVRCFEVRRYNEILCGYEVDCETTMLIRFALRLSDLVKAGPPHLLIFSKKVDQFFCFNMTWTES